MSDYTKGREILVRFTCGRCKTNITQNVKPGSAVTAVALRDKTKAPEGWLDATAITPMLCESCAEAFKSFLRGDPAALPLNISPQTAAAMQEMDRQAHGFYFDEDAETSGLLEED